MTNLTWFVAEPASHRYIKTGKPKRTRPESGYHGDNPVVWCLLILVVTLLVCVCVSADGGLQVSLFFDGPTRNHIIYCKEGLFEFVNTSSHMFGMTAFPFRQRV